MELNQPIGSKMPSQEHLNFINKLNDAKIPRQSRLIANRSVTFSLLPPFVSSV